MGWINQACEAWLLARKAHCSQEGNKAADHFKTNGIDDTLQCKPTITGMFVELRAPYA